MVFSTSDRHHMRSALALARTGLGVTAPNPSVGCVIVKDNIVLGRACTARGGRPHAETQALSQAGEAARGATAYVTLEPCSHRGQTGPCAQALIDAGIARVAVACGDPDPRVAGRGLAMLNAAGVAVETGLLREEAESINRGFFLTKTAGRPLVTLKTAATLDAKVATSSGESKWITGAPARQYGRLERSLHDAVAVGIGTVLADDPSLTSRLCGFSDTITRIVFDTHLRFPMSSNLLKALPEAGLWVICGEGCDPVRRTEIESVGVKTLVMPLLENGKTDLSTALSCIASQGITRVMVEGGPALVSAFLKAGLYDRLLWFRAPLLLGAEARDAIGGLEIQTLDQACKPLLQERRILGSDLLEIYGRNA